MVKLDNRKLWALLGSFLITLFLIYYISGVESTVVERRVKLNIVAPEGMTVLGGPFRQIKVRLSAPKNVLSILSTEELTAEHKITNVTKAGKYSFQVRKNEINLPHHGIKVDDVRPEVVTVTLDEVVKKKLSVRANIIGVPVDFDSIVTDPTAAVVKGPKSKIAKKEIILTDVIDVVGRIRSFRVRVPLKYNSQYSVDSSETIDVFIPIVQEGITREIKDVTISVLQSSASNFSINVDPGIVSIPVKGPEKVVQRLEGKSIKAYVDVTALSRGDYRLPLMLRLPNDVSLVRDVPVINVSIDDKTEKMIPAMTADILPSASEVK